MLFKRKLNSKNTMSWNDYNDRINFLDTFFWQQSVRNEGLQ